MSGDGTALGDDMVAGESRMPMGKLSFFLLSDFKDAEEGTVSEGREGATEGFFSLSLSFEEVCFILPDTFVPFWPSLEHCPELFGSVSASRLQADLVVSSDCGC